MATPVYLLCGLSSLLCAGLLVRSYLANRTRFLLWSSLAFTLLAASNVILIVDLVLVPQMDLIVYRQLLTFTAVTLLCWGFIWDTR